MRYLKNVVTLELNRNKCLGCNMCVNVCPHRVFSIGDDCKAEIVDKDACMECGGCAKNCPTRAINVKTGVGCAVAVIKGWVNGTEPNCDCSDDDCC